MSIYSGFATRKLQQTYNILLTKLLFSFQQSLDYLLSIILPLNNKNQQKKFDKRAKQIAFILQKMRLFEQHKYLQPKFSQICQPLQKILIKFTEKDDQNCNIQNNSKTRIQKKQSKKLNKTYYSLTQPKRNKYSLQKDRNTLESFKKQKNLQLKPKTQNFKINNHKSLSSDNKIIQILKVNSLTPLNPSIRIYKSVQKQRKDMTPSFLSKQTQKTTNFSTQIIQKGQTKNLLNESKKAIYIKTPYFQSNTRQYMKKRSKVNTQQKQKQKSFNINSFQQSYIELKQCQQK